MSVKVSMGSGGVGVSVSMNSVGSGGSEDEEEQDEDTESAHDDDEEDVNEINHTQLPKEVEHAHSPRRRVRGGLSDNIWDSLKTDEIRMIVILRMNHEFMEYMRDSYPVTPLSEFKEADTYVRGHGGVDSLDDDEDDE